MIRIPLLRPYPTAPGYAVFALLVAAGPACAGGDAGTPAATWSGLYFGGNFGYGTGSLGHGTTAILDQSTLFPPSITGAIGGLQAGVNVPLQAHAVAGVEVDLTFPGPSVQQAGKSPALTTAVDYFGAMRGRLGYAAGAVMPYVSGGLAWGQTTTNAYDAIGNQISATPRTHIGWTAGAGLEFQLAGRWSAKAEYDYLRLGTQSAGAAVVTPDAHLLKLGLNYRLQDSGAGETAPVWPPQTDFKTWNIHGQSTVIAQGYPAIRSLYQGAQSLPAGGETRETLSATAFVGLRVAKGLEIYFDPELDQGGGIGKTTGLGGFSNGEALKSGKAFPSFRLQRYFVQKTIGLGGATETVADAPDQLAGTKDINRLTFTVGRLAVTDFFDNNSYARDPRADFMNWAVWSSAAYDFPADLPGLTRGGVAELNTKDWALRAGAFQVPEMPGSDVLAFKTGGLVVELENRYKLGGQDGKLRLGSFVNRAMTGDYRQALADAAASPGLEINTAIQNTAEQRVKYGFYANVEQAITADLGIFARASWNDGRTQILSFTDIDRGLTGGLSLKGTRWGRASDVVGVSGAINGLSAAHRDFLAAGGLGLLVGDGALTYRSERIFETYYALNLAKGSTLTTDYQFVANPAYNADRGPVSIISSRLHVEF